MKLHEQTSGPLQQITAHGNGAIMISGDVVRAPCLVSLTQRIVPWIPDIDALDEAALAALWPLEPRIALLGHTPANPARWRELRRACTAHGIALEVMDLGAACRTFNVLAAEDRAVAAMLFP
ncbi:MAG: Mth938-like domain-containing protein [Steroidobacteraceae bacterium]